MADLHVLRLMPKPTTVALLYAQQQQKNCHENMGSGSEKIALVFNMGAGFVMLLSLLQREEFHRLKPWQW